MSAVLGTPRHESLLWRMARMGDRGLWQSGPIGALRKARYERRYEAAHGNVGTAYFALRRLLPFPADLTWLVHDVPAVAEQDRLLARDENAPGLRFTSETGELPHADILLIKGAVRFLRDPIDFMMHSRRLPRHVLIKKVRICDRDPAVALEANGVAFCPYHLLNKRQFAAAFEDQGYRCVDSWLNYDLNCFIPFYPEYTILTYSGYYFVRETS